MSGVVWAPIYGVPGNPVLNIVTGHELPSATPGDPNMVVAFEDRKSVV